MMEYVVNLIWDNEASVWTATSDDIPGVVAKIKSRHTANAILIQSGIEFRFR